MYDLTITELLLVAWMFLGFPLRIVLCPLTFLVCLVMFRGETFWRTVETAAGFTYFMTLFGLPPFSIA